jgi:glycosyltransferase involved in cell wall biosynthesis
MDYSIIIPAFNEEKYLPRTLRTINASLLDLPGKGEVIVVDNNSTDRTAEIAHAEGARVIFEPVNQISRARNAGAHAAIGRYLIFLDADTLASRALIESAIRALRSGRVCGGGAVLAMDQSLGVFGELGVGLWNWISTTFKLAAGSFVFCLKEGFEAVGGFSEKVFAAEEIIFSRVLKKWGRRRGLRFRVLEADPVITSARKIAWHGAGGVFWALCVLLFFPFALRYRSMCGLWYDRPRESSRRGAKNSKQAPDHAGAPIAPDLAR